MRRLVLRKETLAELTGAELAQVAGGATRDCVEPPTGICLPSYQVLCFVSRAMAHCPTDETFAC